jgi:hypothetical protein
VLPQQVEGMLYMVTLFVGGISRLSTLQDDMQSVSDVYIIPEFPLTGTYSSKTAGRFHVAKYNVHERIKLHGYRLQLLHTFQLCDGPIHDAHVLIYLKFCF